MYTTSFTIKLMVLTALLCIGTTGIANERGQSVMFNDVPGNQDEQSMTTTHTPMDLMNAGESHCEQLIKEIESLKGKPQRRFAAQQRFEQECRQANDNKGAGGDPFGK